MFAGEHYWLLKRLEAGLSQEDRYLPARRTFDQGLWLNAALRHQGLRAVNIQRPRREVVDMTSREADHIGNQAMLAMQRVVGLLIDGGMPVPAEGLQRLLHELAGFRRGERPFGLMPGDQRQTAGSEYVAPGEDRLGSLTQSAVFDQLQTQQRGKTRNGLRASAASSTGRNAVE